MRSKCRHQWRALGIEPLTISCILYSLSLHKWPTLQETPSYTNSKISPLDYSPFHCIACKHKHRNAPYTHEQRCTHADTHPSKHALQSSSSTDTKRHTHADGHGHTHTLARRCSRTQNKHTQGFGVLVSICGEAILSLWLSPSLTNSSQGGSYCGHVTNTAAVVCVWIRAGVCICMCASLLMCIYLIVWMVLCK